jgi:hypothetical protein
MYYEKITKYKTKVNMSKYREDIKQIFNALLKEDTKFENYYLYKEDYDIFIDGIIGKIVSLKPLDTNNDSNYLIDSNISILQMDRQIMIKPKEKTVIGLMKKI